MTDFLDTLAVGVLCGAATATLYGLSRVYRFLWREWRDGDADAGLFFCVAIGIPTVCAVLWSALRVAA